MTEMNWTQSFPVPPQVEVVVKGVTKKVMAKVTVAVEVEGWTDEMNRQLSAFTAGLIRRGVFLSGHDFNGVRILSMGAVVDQ